MVLRVQPPRKSADARARHPPTHTHTRGRAREAGLRRLQIRATHHLALPLLGPAVRPSRRYKAVRGSRSLCLLRTDPDRSERHHPATASDGAQLLYTVRGTSGGCRTQPRIPSPSAESSTLREAPCRRRSQPYGGGATTANRGEVSSRNIDYIGQHALTPCGSLAQRSAAAAAARSVRTSAWARRRPPR